MAERWARVEKTIAGLLVGLALLFSMYEILIRYFLPELAYDWGEEVIVYMVVWGVWILASTLVHEDRHVRADLLIRLLPPGGQRYVELFNSVLGLVFCVVIIWFAYDMVALSYDFGEESGSSLRFPMWIYYLSLPVGAALMLARYLRRIWLFLFRYDPETMHVGEETHAGTVE